MITATAAKDKELCAACQVSWAAVAVEIGDSGFYGRYPLCNRCAHTLVENLQRKEAPAHAGTK